MSNELFKQGGPHRIKKTGLHEHSFSISLPTDRDGRLARECPNQDCSPGEFKVKPGTGITDGQETVFCPYCSGEAEPSAYNTKEQVRYAKDVVMGEAHEGIQSMIGKTLGLNSQGKKKLTSGGLIDISMEMKSSRKPPVRRPFSEILKRDVVCPNCSLDHSVFGLATWCSDCGKDIFTTHLFGEIGIIKKSLSDIPRRERELGDRIAAKDIENALEDIVSVFEAVLKYEVRRYLKNQGLNNDEVEKQMKKIGSRLQSVRNAKDILPKQCGIGFESFEQQTMDKLDILFQKRHPITHNLGVIDRNYLERIRSSEKEGREVRVSTREVEASCDQVFELLEGFHLQLYPDAIPYKEN